MMKNIFFVMELLFSTTWCSNVLFQIDDVITSRVSDASLTSNDKQSLTFYVIWSEWHFSVV